MFYLLTYLLDDRDELSLKISDVLTVDVFQRST